MFNIGENVGETSSLNIFECIRPLWVQFLVGTQLNMSKLKTNKQTKMAQQFQLQEFTLYMYLQKGALTCTRMFTKHYVLEQKIGEKILTCSLIRNQLNKFQFIYAAKWLPWWLSGKESACQCRRFGFDPWVGKIPWRRKWQPSPVFLQSDRTYLLNNNNNVANVAKHKIAFRPPPRLSGEEFACPCEDTGDMGSIPGSGRSSGEGNVNPLQQSCLANSMDRGASDYSPWGCIELDKTE